MRAKITLLLSFISIFLYSQDPALSAQALSLNGIAISLDGEGTASICADDLIPDYYTKCTIEEVRLLRFGDSFDNSTATLDLSCDDVGVMLVSVWIRNIADNWSSSETFALIQDPLNACEGGGTGPNFSVTVATGLSTNLDEEGQLTVHARDFLVGCYDESFDYSFSEEVTDTIRTLTCNEEGTVVVQIWGTDDNGMQSYAETYILAESLETDCPSSNLPDCTPNVFIYNGLAIGLPKSGVVHLHVDDFVLEHLVQKDCHGDTPIAYSFSPDPENKWLQVDCNSPETFIVSVYGTDEAGNQGYAQTYLLVQDNQNWCLDADAYVATNDSICNAVSLDPYLGGCPVGFSNINATGEVNEPTPELGGCTAAGFWCDDTADATLWYTFTAPSTGNAIFETNIFNTQLAVWEASDCQAILNGDAILVAAADDIAADNTNGTLLELTCLIPGQTYYLQLDGFMGDQNQGYLTFDQGADTCPISELSFDCDDGASVALLNGTGTWKQFTDTDGQYLVSANDNGSYIGIIQMSLQTVQGDIRVDEIGQPYMNRNWSFDAESEPLEPFRIRFLFTQEEFFALAAASPTINTLEDLRLTRVPMGTCGEFNNIGEFYDQTGSGVLDPGTNTLYAEFELPDFSAFYLHGPEPLVITDQNNLEQNIDFQTLSPNPTTQETILSLGLRQAADLQIRIIQLDGTIISARRESLLEGNHQLRLELGYLSPGVYLVDVQGPQSRQAKRLIIVP